MERDQKGRFRSDTASVRAVVPVRMTEEDKARLVAIAEEMGESPTILARKVLVEWLDQQEAAKRPDTKSGGFQQAA